MKWVTVDAGEKSEDGRFRISAHEAMRGARYFLAYRGDDPVPLGVFGSYAEACRHCEQHAELLAA